MESILNVLAETEDNLLTCPICLASLDRPKILACLHTFCLSCLSKHQVTSELMMEERMLMAVTEQERRTWQRIREQLLEHGESLAEPYGEPQGPSSDEIAECHLHCKVDNGQQQQQQQQFICCPICRELTALPYSWLLGLRDDFRLQAFSKSLQTIRLQCTFPQVGQDCHEGHSKARTSSAQITLLDQSTLTTADQKHQRKTLRLERICEVNQRSRSRAQSTKTRKNAWKCIVRSFSKCLFSSSAFDENFTEVLWSK